MAHLKLNIKNVESNKTESCVVSLDSLKLKLLIHGNKKKSFLIQFDCFKKIFILKNRTQRSAQFNEQFAGSSSF